MKLRNKKTGVVGELHYEPDKEYHFTVATDDPGDMAIYRTLAELNAKWEDYEPIEPLIKDEKIRKAVRAWAEVGNIKEVGVVISREGTTFCDDNTGITLYGELSGLIDGADYTIDELCGEEEE